jgi:hypothetical protein
MRRWHARLTALERRVTPEPRWHDVGAAMARARHRALVKVCALLGIDAEDNRVMAAAVGLTGDTDAQRQADDALLAAHRTPDREIRARLMVRLEAMAARLDA